MTPGDRTPAADPARLTEEQVAAIEERQARVARGAYLGRSNVILAEEDVPALVAEVRALAAERDEARAERDELFMNALTLVDERDRVRDEFRAAFEELWRTTRRYRDALERARDYEVLDLKDYDAKYGYGDDTIAGIVDAALAAPGAGEGGEA